MLIRMITVIALFQFMLLMISGTNTEVALYRSILVFMVLYTVVYLSIFFINIIRHNPDPEHSSEPEISKSQAKEEG